MTQNWIKKNMCKRIYLIICALVFASSISAQEISREQKIEELGKIYSQVEQTPEKLDELIDRQNNLLDEIFAVNAQDRAEAKRIGAEAERYFPAGFLKNLFSTAFEDNWSYSSYVFMPGSASYLPPRIEYQNNSLE